MTDGPLSGVMRQLRSAALMGDVEGLPDGQLLERFLGERDERAFEVLVRRHGPMVLGVCRRILGNSPEADDAFQTTFLVLVRRAASIVPSELVGHWVYGVAYRTALRARRMAFSLRAREKQVAEMPEREALQSENWKDWQPLLDRELSRLPEIYRVPVVLCELGGKNKKEIAQHLGVPEGTVSSRLARGLELLRKRFVQRGLTLSVGALALSEAVASPAVPAALLRSTVQVSLLVASGRAAAAGVLSASVASLLDAVLHEMVVAKLKTGALVLLAVSLVGLATGFVAHQTFAERPPDALAAAVPLRPLNKVDAPEDQPAAAVVRVAEINPTGSSNPSGLVNVNGMLFFAAKDDLHGNELWKSSPTPNGPVTTLVKDIFPDRGDSNPRYLINVNGRLFFVANDGLHGSQLWKSDGTEAGTVMVKHINPGRGAFPAAGKNLIAVCKTLFFVAADAGHGAVLWKSDGTEAGTVVVKRLDASNSISTQFPQAMTDVNGMLFFAASDGVHGTELWKSDGTEAGTVMVKDINPGRSHSWPCFLTNVNGTLFFVAQEGVHGRELWKSDGTQAGTVLVKDINPGSASAFPRQHIGNLTAVGKTLFFAADDGVHGEQLWRSDGTKAGTVLVKAIGSGKKGSELARSSYDALAEVNGTVYFAANDGVHGRELWKSDGTEAGTVLVKDIAPGGNDANLDSLTNVNGMLFFAASDGIHCKKLWKSDGTQAGTVPVKDFFPDSEKPFPLQRIGQLVAVDKTLFFMADWAGNKDRSSGGYGELWHMPIPGRPTRH
jgi:RNA polymerase sigma factor (sigma-70 family)